MRDAPATGRSSSWAGARRLTRRRAIRIFAAAAGLPLMIAAVRATAPPAQMFHWQGEVLDALAELTLVHTDAALARRTILTIEGEIARYERIFSLYQPESEISRLNAAGILRRPAPELRTLIEQSQHFGVMSGGAFDISVQPLWRLYEAHFWSHARVVPDIVASAQDVARELVDFRRIETGAGRIAFARAGMGITLNSVAQGFITDAVADMLRNQGFESAVVDLGEFPRPGPAPGWPSMADRDPGPAGGERGRTAPSSLMTWASRCPEATARLSSRPGIFITFLIRRPEQAPIRSRMRP